jgi:hypothetical protein
VGLDEGSACKNIEDWKMEIKRLWALKMMKDSEYLWNLVLSIPRRLQQVLERLSGVTKY